MKILTPEEIKQNQATIDYLKKAPKEIGDASKQIAQLEQNIAFTELMAIKGVNNVGENGLFLSVEHIAKKENGDIFKLDSNHFQLMPLNNEALDGVIHLAQSVKAVLKKYPGPFNSNDPVEAFDHVWKKVREEKAKARKERAERRS